MKNYAAIALLVCFFGATVSQAGEVDELITATQKGDWRAVQGLVHFEKQLFERIGLALLHVAAEHNQYQLIEQLAAWRECDVDRRSDERLKSRTPLVHACVFGHLKVVEALLKAGADPNRAASDGATSLYIVSGKGFADVARLLLRAGADASLANNKGLTALMTASSFGHTAVIIALKKYAGINQARPDGLTALHFAAQKGQTAVVEFLIDAGGRIDAQDSSGDTPLHLAAKYGHIETVRFLVYFVLEKFNPEEFSIDTPCCQGVTPLLLAANHGHLDVARILREVGADPKKTTRCGANALHIAAAGGNAKVVEFLLRADEALDINARCSSQSANFTGITPLHLAAQKGYFSVVRILKQAGADTQLRMSNGLTAAQVAREEGYLNIANYLED